MRTKYLFIIILLSFFSTAIKSQDTIYMKNGDIINTWIKLKTEKKVRYKLLNTKDSPIIQISIHKIEKIKFRDGTVFPKQEDVIRMKKRLGLKAGFILGLDEESVYQRIGVDYFLRPGWSLELSILNEGGDIGILLGPKVYLYPYSKKNLKAYLGLQTGFNYEEFCTSFPIGISYVHKSGFEFSTGFYNLYYPLESIVEINAGISLGWRF